MESKDRKKMENTKSKHKKVGVDIFVSDQVVQEKKT